jgi:hypothetical protein
MRQIAIGDHVRLLAGKEQGYVRAIRKNIIDVEIEEGFIIPVLDKELVVISSEEKKYFQSEHIQKLDESERAVDGDLFLALQPTENMHYNLLLINQTLSEVLFTTYLSSIRGWQALQHGELRTKDYVILQNLHFNKIDEASEILINWIPVVKKPTQDPIAISKKIKLRAKWLINPPQPLPIIKQKGYLIHLTSEAIKVDVVSLKEAMMNPKSKTETANKSHVTRVPETIDLHIENLVEDVNSIPKNEMLKFQVNHFEKLLDQAIIQGMSEITFIHGVGNGTLKYNIEKKCSGHPHIAYFKDAMKEKFGYGAIFIKLK